MLYKFCILGNDLVDTVNDEFIFHTTNGMVGEWHMLFSLALHRGLVPLAHR